MEKETKIKVLLVEPNSYPRVIEIEDTLEAKQRIVGGYIEMIVPYEDDVAIICNEEGKINGLPLNRSIKDENGEIVDIIAGTFFVCYAPAFCENFHSLPDELIDKYAELYKMPCQYYKDMTGKIVEEHLPLIQYAILQLNDSERNHLIRFMGLDYIKGDKSGVNANDYDVVYKGYTEFVDMTDEMQVIDKCEGLFAQFNVNRPIEFKGHSMSVSDVIILRDNNGEEQALYCDSVGFVRLPDSFLEQYHKTNELCEGLYNNYKDIIDAFTEPTEQNLDLCTKEEGINFLRDKLNDTIFCDKLISYIGDDITKKSTVLNEIISPNTDKYVISSMRNEIVTLGNLLDDLVKHQETLEITNENDKDITEE